MIDKRLILYMKRKTKITDVDVLLLVRQYSIQQETRVSYFPVFQPCSHLVTNLVGTHSNHCCLIESLWNYEKPEVNQNKIEALLSLIERLKFEGERSFLNRVQFSSKILVHLGLVQQACIRVKYTLLPLSREFGLYYRCCWYSVCRLHPHVFVTVPFKGFTRHLCRASSFPGTSRYHNLPIASQSQLTCSLFYALVNTNTDIFTMNIIAVFVQKSYR